MVRIPDCGGWFSGKGFGPASLRPGGRRGGRRCRRCGFLVRNTGRLLKECSAVSGSSAWMRHHGTFRRPCWTSCKGSLPSWMASSTHSLAKADGISPGFATGCSMTRFSLLRRSPGLINCGLRPGETGSGGSDLHARVSNSSVVCAAGNG